jgi:hypothetical protein
VTLPSTMQRIGRCSFWKCTALTAIAIPKGCRLDHDTFYKCRLDVLSRR